MHLKSSIVIESPIEKVYKTAETYPTFVKLYDTKSIIKSDDDEIIVNVGYRLFGLCIRWSGIGKKTKNHSINYIQTKGLLKGMEARWNFIPLGDKTQVIINAEVKKSLSFLNWFIKKIVQKMINGILGDLKDKAEREKN